MKPAQQSVVASQLPALAEHADEQKALVDVAGMQNGATPQQLLALEHSAPEHPPTGPHEKLIATEATSMHLPFTTGASAAVSHSAKMMALRPSLSSAVRRCVSVDVTVAEAADRHVTQGSLGRRGEARIEARAARLSAG